MIPYVQLESIAKSFGDLVLYEDINMTVGEGQRVALIAKNGAGKTTLLNIISGKESPDKGNVTFSKDISVGFLEQEPILPKDATVFDAVHCGRGWEEEHLAKAILSKLKITNLDQKVEQLSGGQHKRVALAAILIDNPDLLIMDEPTNHLDLEMVEWLEEFLIKRNKALLLVTHDRYFLDRICSDIYELDQAQIICYRGGYSDYIMKREERIAQFNTEVDKAQNIYRRELEWMRRMPQARGTKAKYRKDAFYETKDKAFAKRDDSKVEINIKSQRLGTKIFEVKNVFKNYGDLAILKDFSYTFSRSQKLGIVGKNGTGKSTFLNILTGAMTPDSGIVDIGDSVRFGYYHQQGMKFDPSSKVIDIVKDIAEIVTLGDGKTITASQFLTHFLFAPETQYNFVSKLSGGERRRLYLLTILMQSPNFLILDEPTNDLDIVTLNVLEDYLASFGGCIIIVSHDRYFMDKVAEELLVFEGDGVISNFPGNYTQYRNSQPEDEKEQSAPKPKIYKQQSERQRKMTFKEKMEFEALEKEIEKLEQEKQQIESDLNSGNLDAQSLMEKSTRIGEVIEMIDTKSMRWLELSEL